MKSLLQFTIEIICSHTLILTLMYVVCYTTTFAFKAAANAVNSLLLLPTASQCAMKGFTTSSDKIKALESIMVANEDNRCAIFGTSAESRKLFTLTMTDMSWSALLKLCLDACTFSAMTETSSNTIAFSQDMFFSPDNAWHKSLGSNVSVLARIFGVNKVRICSTSSQVLSMADMPHRQPPILKDESICWQDSILGTRADKTNCTSSCLLLILRRLYNELVSARVLKSSSHELILGARAASKFNTSELWLDILEKPHSAIPTSWAFIGFVHDSTLGMRAVSKTINSGQLLKLRRPYNEFPTVTGLKFSRHNWIFGTSAVINLKTSGDLLLIFCIP